MNGCINYEDRVFFLDRRQIMQGDSEKTLTKALWNPCNTVMNTKMDFLSYLFFFIILGGIY